MTSRDAPHAAGPAPAGPAAPSAERYSRQTAIPEVGPDGQARIGAARVLVAGLGGLGCPAALYLAAAGVGGLTLVDPGRVEESNLHRQILYGAADVGAGKAARARDRLALLRPDLAVAALPVALTPDTAREFVPGHDAVVDGLDSDEARAILARACMEAGVPLVHGGIRRLEGRAILLAPGGPCLLCLLPGPEEAAAPSPLGVLGPVPGVIGALQAALALRWILWRPRGPQPLHVFDAGHGRMLEVATAVRPGCAGCGGHGVPPS